VRVRPSPDGRAQAAHKSMHKLKHKLMHKLSGSRPPSLVREPPASAEVRAEGGLPQVGEEHIDGAGGRAGAPGLGGAALGPRTPEGAERVHLLFSPPVRLRPHPAALVAILRTACVHAHFRPPCGTKPSRSSSSSRLLLLLLLLRFSETVFQGFLARIARRPPGLTPSRAWLNLN
jgi:hypothetical protein